jgi:hypothetical protein
MAMLLALSFSFCGIGCAGELSTATTLANTIGRTLSAMDRELGDQQQADRVAADKKYPDDNVAYGAALTKDNAIADAFDVVWREHGLLHVALANWTEHDDRTGWKLAAVCTAQALERLSAMLEQRWRNEISLAVAALRQSAGGDAQCGEVRP